MVSHSLCLEKTSYKHEKINKKELVKKEEDEHKKNFEEPKLQNCNSTLCVQAKAERCTGSHIDTQIST